MKCTPTFLDIAKKFLNITLFYADMILFKSNLCIAVFISVPLLLGISVIN
jgi:hypothetical protein